MTFREVLAQIVDWLQQDGRVSYLALKRQFDIDDNYLNDLKESLLYTHAERLHDDGQGLVWSEEPTGPSPNAQSETDGERVAITKRFSQSRPSSVSQNQDSG